jgi:hypothetical protein
MRLMIIITSILHRVEPICKPLYALGSSLLPFLAPFHNATNIDYFQSWELRSLSKPIHITLTSHEQIYHFSLPV